MTVERSVIEHYRHGALEDALLKGLAAAGKDIDRLAPDDLAPADEFHIGGRQASGLSGLCLQGAEDRADNDDLPPR